MIDVNRRVLPGFRLSLGYTLVLPEPAGADPADGVLPQGVVARPVDEFVGGGVDGARAGRLRAHFGASLVGGAGQHLSSAC